MNKYAVQITNDAPSSSEFWGPYDTAELAEEVKQAFVGVPESAKVVPCSADAAFTGRPE